MHGDYRLDNVLAAVDPVAGPRGARLGDGHARRPARRPRAAAGLLERARRQRARRGNPVADGIGPHDGFPPIEDELIDRYAGRSDLDVGPLPWYVALGYYKLAVICEGIHYRHLAGQTVGPGFDRIGEMVPPLVAAGRAALT